MYSSQADVLSLPYVAELLKRAVIQIVGSRITYNLAKTRSENWDDPEEWVRAHSVAWLIVERDYPADRMLIEVRVPRRVPSDLADIVVYRDAACRAPYLIVENKAAGRTPAARAQAIEQAFGNANSLRAPLTLYDEGDISILYDVLNYPAGERTENIKGERDAVPRQYDEAPIYSYIAGGRTDIAPLPSQKLESKIRV